MRFDQLIRASMTVRDIRQKYPQTAETLEGFGFRSSCDDCTIDVLARKYGLSAAMVVETLNEAAFGSKDSEEPTQ
jgi:hypothetical protein